MCGIAGFIGQNVNPKVLQTWSKLLEHRGPDDVGLAVLTANQLYRGQDSNKITATSRAVLWHRRLSILDLSQAGWQPMQRDNLCIVFNGEIYNYLELRQTLIKLGATFSTTSDTEVLLQAYRFWGTEMLPKLIGMFAFAILDLDKQELLLARDPFGIKPLYLAQTQHGLAFASEQKVLLTLPEVRRIAHAESVYQYLVFGVTDHGQNTMLADIKQLPPAQYLRISLDKPHLSQPVRYWQLNRQQQDLSFDEAVTHLREMFLQSISLHLRSDVPVGACLSGGIDSSAIVCAMRQLAPQQEIHTFSFIANGELSEARYAQAVSEAAKTVWHQVSLVPHDLAQDFETLLRVQDEPFGSSSIYAQFKVFALAQSQGMKVMLDGQGADELLGGYRPMIAARVASLVRQGHYGLAFKLLRHTIKTSGSAKILFELGQFLTPAILQDPLRQLVGHPLAPDWLNTAWFYKTGVTFKSAKYNTKSSQYTLIEQLERSLLESSVPMLLRYEDRNSMAHGIESRVPFLTPQLAEFVLGLPESYIINARGTTKFVFREAMRGIVPNMILDRTDKIGFATPERQWLTALRPLIQSVLYSEYARTIPMLHIDKVQHKLGRMLAGQEIFDFRAWRWLNFVHWAERIGLESA